MSRQSSPALPTLSRLTANSNGFRSAAPSRSSYGRTFLDNNFAKANAFANSTYSAKTKTASKISFQTGDTVKHNVFGKGVVVSAVPMANDTLLEIAFENTGTKKLMANFAKLEKLC